MSGTNTLARGLGWFSIGLGLTEVIAAEALGKTLGLEKHTALIRGYGLRELGAGIGILSKPEPAAGWLWARVAGDALDIATLASALNDQNPKRTNAGIALAAVAGVTALDVLCAEQLGGATTHRSNVPVPTRISRYQSPEAGAPPGASEIVHSITIGKPAQELYELWKQPETQTRIKSHFAEVTVGGQPGHMHWKVNRGKLLSPLEWDTEIVDERPGELVRWKSLPGGDLPSEATVTFKPAPDGWGTEVRLHYKFDPPGGIVGKVAARFGSDIPDTIANDALRRFKALAETGEIPTLEGNVSARGKDDTV